MKYFRLCLVALMAALLLCSCGEQEEVGSVYYLNFKPEAADTWEEIAEAYTAETGVEVKILTAASGNYEQTLKAEIAKREAPTLFQINGPVGYSTWKNFCEDLSDTELYSWLLDKSLAVSDDSGVYGIPYVVEGYGIIYNDAIMQKYFALPTKAVPYGSMDEINTFDKLKAVVEDMTLQKAALGIEGVFASTSFSAGEDWRWQTHLANLPVYYEFEDKGIADSATLDFTYSENFKNIFDLYINNSCTDRTALASKTVNNSMEEFALGKVAMVQNGNWAWGQISSIAGNVVKEENVKFLPIYTGVAGEEKQGLCTGTENYWCVNKDADKADIDATLKFINWCVTSDKGTKAMSDMGFVIPFAKAAESTNLFVNMDSANTAAGLVPVSWNFPTMPSEQWKNNVGNALTAYAADQTDAKWDAVESAFINGWATEYELNNK